MKVLHWKKILLCLVLPSMVAVGCSGDDTVNPLNNSIPVKGISLPASISLGKEELFVLKGMGVELTDRIELENKEQAGQVFTVPVSESSSNTFGFALPQNLTSGTYRLTLVRNEKRLPLGTVNINITVSVQIPDKVGMTVKGMVQCDGAGVAGVVVSDGYEVVQTNEKGIYYLPSGKKNKYVFISIPSNYEVECRNGNEPQFFKYLSQPASEVERVDFSLRKVDNNSHKLFVMTDAHLANRNNDLKQYASFVEDINRSIAEESVSGVRAYGIDLGDLSWDVYWYSNNFALPQCLTETNKINCPVFHLPGNHDNDPYKSNDWDAMLPFKEGVCPNYYSVNLGGVHYVMLDNIRYNNNGAAEGVVGERNYDGVIVADQMEWLKKDLAFVADKSTPIVVAMHINLYRNPSVLAGNQLNVLGLENGKALQQILSDFTDVHVLTGHTHINFTVEKDNWMEHNVAAVSATWWWTGKDGYAGNHICKDGSPGGYAVWSMDGKDLQWYYKGIGMEKERQFRTYDLNETHITAAKYAPNTTDEKLAPYAGNYAQQRTDHKVLINVWNYDEQWKVEVTENGKPLAVKRVSAKDPLHIISYEAKRLDKGATPTASFDTELTGHMFEVTASSAESTLDIRVTDRFGRVYTERMVRPKALECEMK